MLIDVDDLSDDDIKKVRSRYAEQPADLRQGVESAYKSLGENFKEAAQTILAVPMEVYERSGNEVSLFCWLSNHPELC
jgi:autophagy-related protein 2